MAFTDSDYLGDNPDGLLLMAGHNSNLNKNVPLWNRQHMVFCFNISRIGFNSYSSNMWSVYRSQSTNTDEASRLSIEMAEATMWLCRNQLICEEDTVTVGYLNSGKLTGIVLFTESGIGSCKESSVTNKFSRAGCYDNIPLFLCIKEYHFFASPPDRGVAEIKTNGITKIIQAIHRAYHRPVFKNILD